MAKYQGYRSWNAWNVCLWIGNEQSVYNHCKDLCNKLGINRAADRFAAKMKGQKTPDGARYTRIAILETFKGFFK